MITSQKQYDDNKIFSKFIRFLKEYNAYICWKKKVVKMNGIKPSFNVIGWFKKRNSK